MGFSLWRSRGNSKIRYSWPRGLGANWALILPDLINRRTVLDDTPGALAACAIVNPCFDIGIDKCRDKPWSLSGGQLSFPGGTQKKDYRLRTFTRFVFPLEL